MGPTTGAVGGDRCVVSFRFRRRTGSVEDVGRCQPDAIAAIEDALRRHDLELEAMVVLDEQGCVVRAAGVRIPVFK